MKERPIIMSGDNPRLIIEGEKTQTRRLVTGEFLHNNELIFKRLHFNRLKRTYREEYVDFQTRCPYGFAGDRLWVRESYCCKMEDGLFVYDCNGEHVCLYAADDIRVTKDDGDGGVAYRKDGTEASPWIPSIHMPRWASRITLEILNVRVERVQDISEEDAKAEGWPNRHDIFHPSFQASIDNSYRRNGAVRWDSLHGKGSWDKNPWVWVIEFSRV